MWFGFLQAMRNAGYGVGGVLAAVALTIGSGAAYQAVVLANAASYLLAFVLMVGVAARAGVPRVGGADAGAAAWVAFPTVATAADRGDLPLRAGQMTLNVTMPVYFVDCWAAGLGAGRRVRDQHRDDRPRSGARGALDDRDDAAPGAAGRDGVHRRPRS